MSMIVKDVDLILMYGLIAKYRLSSTVPHVPLRLLMSGLMRRRKKVSESRVYRFFAVLIVFGLACVIFLKLFGLHETVFWRDFWCSLILFILATIIWDCGNTNGVRGD